MSSAKTRRLILRLAYARCVHDRGAGGDPCSECFLFELERHVARLNPHLLREDVRRRVDDWMLVVSPQQRDLSLAG